MNNREVALEFLRCFCAGDVSGLVPLLAEDLQLQGPLYRFRSREAYVDVLHNDPPEPCGYQVLSLTESGDSVAMFYEYAKSDGAITIAQLFQFRHHKIQAILVVFDGRGFA